MFYVHATRHSTAIESCQPAAPHPKTDSEPATRTNFSDHWLCLPADISPSKKYFGCFHSSYESIASSSIFECLYFFKFCHIRNMGNSFTVKIWWFRSCAGDRKMEDSSIQNIENINKSKITEECIAIERRKIRCDWIETYYIWDYVSGVSE